MSNDQAINVRLPPDLHAEVLERAHQEDRTLAATIRVALRFYLQDDPAARANGSKVTA